MRIFTFFLLLLATQIQAQDSLLYKSGWILNRYYPLNNFDSVAKNFDPIFPWGPYTKGDNYFTRFNNVNINDEGLSLEAIKEKSVGEIWGHDSLGNFTVKKDTFDYTSGMLFSKEQFRYGQFEISFKSNKTKGTVGAFWLFGDDNEEIDIFEMLGSNTDRAQTTLHWKDRDPLAGSSQSISYIDLDSGTFADAYHTIGVIWTPDNVIWTFNGEEVTVNTFVNFIRKRHIPQNKLNLIMTLEVGTSDGEPDSSNFPDQIFYRNLKTYTDTLGISIPEIISQNEVNKDFSHAFRIDMNAVNVKDYYDLYPNGFALKIKADSSSDYTFINDSIHATNSAAQFIYLPVIVDDGLQQSEVFQLKVENKNYTGIEEKISTQLLQFNDNLLHIKNGAAPLRIQVISYDGKVLSNPIKISPNNAYQQSIDEPIILLKIKSEQYETVRRLINQKMK